MKKRFVVLMGAVVIAASGGFAGPQHSAYADAVKSETAPASNEGAVQTSPAATVQAAAPLTYADLLVHKQLSQIVTLAFAFADSDIDYSSYLGAVYEGKSLAEAAGVSPGDLNDQLTASVQHTVQAEVAAGSLTATEGEQAVTSLSSAISAAVSGSLNQAARLSATDAGQDLVQLHLSRIVPNTAVYIEGSAADLLRAMQAGQSLAEAAGLSADALSDQLDSQLFADLDNAVQSGKLLAADAEARKAEAAKAIREAVSTPSFDKVNTVWMDRFGAQLVARKLDSAERLAAVQSSKDYSDVLEALAQGKTLADATGISEADLAEQLGSPIHQAIDASWLNGSLSRQAADQWKAKADEALNRLIRGEAPAGSPQADAAIAQGSTRDIVKASASYASLSYEDLKQAVASGQTLVQATGLTEEELLGTLKAEADSYIAEAVLSGRLDRSAEQATREEAYTLIRSAIETAGYAGKVDAQLYGSELASRIVEQAAETDGVNASELLEALAQGYSLSSAAHTDKDSLIYSLLRSANQEINGLAGEGRITDEESAQLKSDYTSSLLELLAK
ncbi:hypothetical protein [Paenibacillus ginsengarvi]|uniref:DUF1002 domain-containing protein n=1 Tax=Paenibacillus ginsengarvi TaxID=400777 RepID=A0A3B0CDW4_9BACL|nr:hypothetical protein [Paenibacillus ginsengarvi]RKN81997.1 hypothetical protein D7M11_18655 [Paenibacillus ginsengarvi]